MEFNDPYGVLPPPSPVAATTLTVYQGTTLDIYRRVTNPDGTPATPQTCYLEFTVVARRFSTETIFQANWDKHMARGIEDRVRITIPSVETAKFLRGPLLYSLVWYDRLRDKTVMLEEGSLLVEYQAGSPNPEIPYNSSAPDSLNEDQTAFF